MSKVTKGLSYRRIVVAGTPAGMLGLDEIFDELYAEGRRPGDSGLAEEIVRRARQENYIPAGASKAFAEVLSAEFDRYATSREGGAPPRRTTYGTWRGYPREQIPWFPTVAEDRCRPGCNKCIRICSSHALIAGSDGRVVVADPFKCVVGCSSCAALCPERAITFPARSILDQFR